MLSKRNVSVAMAGVALAAAIGFAAAATGRELPIGAHGPDFNLRGTDGKTHSLAEVAGAKGTVVVFTCNECPFSKGYEDRLIALARTYESRGIGFVAINANDPRIVPGDGFEFMVRRAREKKFPYPYVVDTVQDVAASYGARVTPHVFLLDGEGNLVYRGRIDDSVKEKEVKSHDLEAALDALLAGKPVPTPETRAFGCSIKWIRQED